jgi:hypothetical protein
MFADETLAGWSPFSTALRECDLIGHLSYSQHPPVTRVEVSSRKLGCSSRRRSLWQQKRKFLHARPVIFTSGLKRLERCRNVSSRSLIIQLSVIPFGETRAMRSRQTASLAFSSGLGYSLSTTDRVRTYCLTVCVTYYVSGANTTTVGARCTCRAD